MVTVERPADAELGQANADSRRFERSLDRVFKRR